MDSTFTLSIDWLAFTVLASNPQETMNVKGDYNAPGNFEVVVSIGSRLQHVWRDGGGWHSGPLFGNNIARSGATLVQGSYGTPHSNLECIAVRVDGTMQHFWRNEATFAWNAGAIFGSGVTSPPVMIQGQYGMQNELGPHGNFELCVAVGGRVQHWWRWNSAGGDGVGGRARPSVMMCRRLLDCVKDRGE